MRFNIINYEDKLWNQSIEYAKACTWKAGPFLAKLMMENRLQDWERVVVAIDNNSIVGFCTVTKEDCLPNTTYSPYIGFMFVDENYRGNRISEKLIFNAISYIKELNFEKVYLISDHINLYEKYGFIKIDEQIDSAGNSQTIFAKQL